MLAALRFASWAASTATPASSAAAVSGTVRKAGIAKAAAVPQEASSDEEQSDGAHFFRLSLVAASLHTVSGPPRATPLGS